MCWPPKNLSALVDDDEFLAAIFDAARRSLPRLREEEVYDGISAFAERALIVGEKKFLGRFPTLFAAVRYVIVAIRNRRIDEARAHKWWSSKHEMELEVDLKLQSPEEIAFEREEVLLEEAIVAFLQELLNLPDDESDAVGLTRIERGVLLDRWMGLSFEVIAISRGISKTTAHRHFQSAIAKVRSTFDVGT